MRAGGACAARIVALSAGIIPGAGDTISAAGPATSLARCIVLFFPEKNATALPGVGAFRRWSPCCRCRENTHISSAHTRRRRLEHGLAAVERFCEALGRHALHAADPGDGAEEVGREPGLAGLREKMPQDESDLLFQRPRRERREEVGDSEIAVVLGDLVLQDHVVAP